MPSRLKILIVALETDWVSPARLPQALQAAGFEVGVACRKKAVLTQTRYADHFFLLPEKRYGRSLLAALRTIVSAWQPDLILPTDDQAVLYLATAHGRLTKAGERGGLTTLVRRSLGNPISILEAASKRRTLEAARQLGIRIPATQAIKTLEEVCEFGRKHGYPMALKRSFDSGGNGVFVCENECEAVRIFKILQAEQSPHMRLMRWREEVRGRLLETSWLSKDESIIACQFIPGKCANSLAAAITGETVGILTTEVEQTYVDANGPASVVRFIHNEEMSRISGALIKHWGLTGLIGFDFILDSSGNAWLLECNPRPTAIGHLGARVGVDLCLALNQGLKSGPAARKAISRELLVAHYPQEKWRAPASPYFKMAFHDIPTDDASLLKALEECPVPRRHRI